MEDIKVTGLQVNILDPKSRTVCIHIIHCGMLKIQIRGGQRAYCASWVLNFGLALLGELSLCSLTSCY